MSRAEDIIETIDVGLQRAMPDPTFGEVSPVNREECWRCSQPAESESGLCGGCRSFLLEDSDEDPARRGMTAYERFARFYFGPDPNITDPDVEERRLEAERAFGFVQSWHEAEEIVFHDDVFTPEQERAHRDDRVMAMWWAEYTLRAERPMGILGTTES